MTRKRRNYLFISLISFLLCVLILAATARADEIEWHGGGYVMGKFAGGGGFSPGVGILAEGQARWKWLEVKVSASTAWQPKKKATFGYTWWMNGQLRGFFWNDFYGVGAYSIAGYKSYFDNGAEWTKYGDNLGFGIGWEPGFADISLIYYLKETSSPNNVQYTALNARYQIWEWLWAMGTLKYVTFDQMWSGNMERWSSMNWSMGLGVRF